MILEAGALRRRRRSGPTGQRVSEPHLASGLPPKPRIRRAEPNSGGDQSEGLKIGNKIVDLQFVKCAEGGHPAFALLNDCTNSGIGGARPVTIVVFQSRTRLWGGVEYVMAGSAGLIEGALA